MKGIGIDTVFTNVVGVDNHNYPGEFVFAKIDETNELVLFEKAMKYMIPYKDIKMLAIKLATGEGNIPQPELDLEDSATPGSKENDKSA